jgi:hypothetical protein
MGCALFMLNTAESWCQGRLLKAGDRHVVGLLAMGLILKNVGF